jgi:hypothetical protein
MELVTKIPLSILGKFPILWGKRKHALKNSMWSEFYDGKIY